MSTRQPPSPFSLRWIIRQAGWSLPLLWIPGVATAILFLIPPRQIGALTDSFAQGPGAVSWRQVNTALLLILGAVLLVTVLEYLRGNGLVAFRERLLVAMRSAFYARLLRLSADFFRERSVDGINTRGVEDTYKLASFWSAAILEVPLAGATLLLYGVYMFQQNWFLAIIMVPLSLLSGYFLVFDARIQKLNRQAGESSDLVRTRTNEMVATVYEFRHHAAFNYGLRILEGPFRMQSRFMRRLGGWNSLFNAAEELVYTLQIYPVYWVGAALCMGKFWLTGIVGQLTWGQVIQFVLVAELFQEPVSKIFSFVLKWRLSLVSHRRVTELMQQAPPELPAPPLSPSVPAAGEISLDSVSVVAKSGGRILNNLTTKIAAGEHVAVVGTPASGKSTILALLAGGQASSAGSVRMGTQEIAKYDLVALARLVGLVPQAPAILEATIRANLLLGLRRDAERTLEDDGGPIDISRLPDVADEGGLDRRLVDVVRLVALDHDVLGKALDRPLPPGPKFASLRQRIPGLRGAVRAWLDTQDPRLVVTFSPEQFLTVGSIGENVLGPGRGPTDITERDMARLLDRLESLGLLAEFLRLGFLRFSSDVAIAVRLAQRAPRLAALFAPAATLSAAPEPLLGLDWERVPELSAAAKRELLGVALDTDADRACELLGEAACQTVALQARRLWLAGDHGALQAWNLAASQEYSEPLSLRENLLCGRVNPLLRRSGEHVDAMLHDLLRKEELLLAATVAGMEYDVGERGRHLSVAQRQKLALARALLKDPAVLLLDEALSSLDVASQARVEEVLQREFAHKTVVSVSHRLAGLRHFDRVLVLDQGLKVQEGPFEALAHQEGLLRALLGTSETPAASAETAPAQGPATAPGTAVGTRHEDETDAVRRCLLFAKLDGDQLAAVLRVARVVECPPGEVIFRRGDSGEELFVIRKGQVEFVAAAADGVERVVDTFGPGQAFGELAVFGRMPRTLGARARTDVVLVQLQREQVVQLMTADPAMALAFLETLSQRIAGLRSELYGPPVTAPAPQP